MKKIISILIFVSTIIYSLDLDELYFGTDSTFEVMTWNIEWFPKNDIITVNYVSQIIQALEVDLLAIQEVDDTIYFNQMLEGIPNYEGYLQSSWFAGLAYIYNTEVIEINDIYEIYITSPYWGPFPRSPMVIDLNFNGENIKIINNHFKCCGDGILEINNPNDEEMRRYTAINLLKEYIDEFFPDDNVIVLGDLNDVLTDAIVNNVFQLVLDDSENYQFADIGIAVGTSFNWSFPSWPSHIDHILMTNELIDEFENVQSEIQTINIDDYMIGGFNEYDENISDHRPVALKLFFNNVLNGDVNSDSLINITDIILTINIILNNEFNSLSDLNNDNIINIIDVILVVNIILGN